MGWGPPLPEIVDHMFIIMLWSNEFFNESSNSIAKGLQGSVVWWRLLARRQETLNFILSLEVWYIWLMLQKARCQNMASTVSVLDYFCYTTTPFSNFELTWNISFFAKCLFCSRTHFAKRLGWLWVEDCGLRARNWYTSSKNNNSVPNYLTRQKLLQNGYNVNSGSCNDTFIIAEGILLGDI